jgi:hypothetical protein
LWTSSGRPANRRRQACRPTVFQFDGRDECWRPRLDDAVRLWVNNQLVIDNWASHPATTDTSASINLTAGVRYTIRLEYYEVTGSARIQLRWTRPGQPAAVIPRAQLFPQ